MKESAPIVRRGLSLPKPRAHHYVCDLCVEAGEEESGERAEVNENEVLLRSLFW